jgi:hypothetical protein
VGETLADDAAHGFLGARFVTCPWRDARPHRAPLTPDVQQLLFTAGKTRDLSQQRGLVGCWMPALTNVQARHLASPKHSTLQSRQVWVWPMVVLK